MRSLFFRQVHTQRPLIVDPLGGNFTADTDTFPLTTVSLLLLAVFASDIPNFLATID